MIDLDLRQKNTNNQSFSAALSEADLDDHKIQFCEQFGTT